LTGLTALGVAEEKVCDCVGNGEAWRLFEPEEFARSIEFDKDVFSVGCETGIWLSRSGFAAGCEAGLSPAVGFEK
jgi:hypothetical protein